MLRYISSKASTIQSSGQAGTTCSANAYPGIITTILKVWARILLYTNIMSLNIRVHQMDDILLQIKGKNIRLHGTNNYEVFTHHWEITTIKTKCVKYFLIKRVSPYQSSKSLSRIILPQTLVRNCRKYETFSFILFSVCGTCLRKHS